MKPFQWGKGKEKDRGNEERSEEEFRSIEFHGNWVVLYWFTLHINLLLFSHSSCDRACIRTYIEFSKVLDTFPSVRLVN